MGQRRKVKSPPKIKNTSFAHQSLPLLFLTSMNPSLLILCKNALPKRPSIPLFRLNRPEMLTTALTSSYLEAYKSATFPPAKKNYNKKPSARIRDLNRLNIQKKVASREYYSFIPYQKR